MHQRVVADQRPQLEGEHGLVVAILAAGEAPHHGHDVDAAVGAPPHNWPMIGSVCSTWPRITWNGRPLSVQAATSSASASFSRESVSRERKRSTVGSASGRKRAYIGGTPGGNGTTS